MSLTTIRIILLSLEWPMLIVGSVIAYRAAAYFQRESGEAPFARRLVVAITALILVVATLGVALTALLFLSDIGVAVAAALEVVLLAGLAWIIYHFGHRAEVVVDHRKWVHQRIEEESAKRSLETRAFMEKQNASLEEGIRDLEHTKSALLNVMEDLSKEKTDAMESQSRTLAILDGIADGIITFDDDGVISLVNPTIESWTGMSRDACVGKPWQEVFTLFNDRMESATDAFAALLFAGPEARNEHHDFLLKTTARTLPVSVAASSTEFGGRRTGTVVVLRDVTVEKRIDQAKSEFISVASHQLRTPLTSMNWYVESILGKDFGRVPAALVPPLETVHMSGRRIASLINALLNVSRIEMGQLRVLSVPVDLVALCDDVVKECTPMILEKDLKFILDYGDVPKVPLDADLLKIVVQNLIVNAVCYTPPKGMITVRLMRDKGRIVLTIVDTGIGIPKAQHSDIFRKMFRASNAARFVPNGTGLGLYICRSVMEQIGGDISFTSKEGKGTTFTVRIPVAGVKSREGEQTLLVDTIS